MPQSRTIPRILTTISVLALLTTTVVSFSILNYVRKSARRDVRIERQLARIDAWLTTPVLDGLKLAELRGQRVKYREFELRLSEELDQLMALAWPQLPYEPFHVPTPELGDVEFQAYQWACNLLAICSWIEKGEDPDARAELDAHLEKADEFVLRDGDAEFYGNPFDFEVADKSLRAPWHSAFSQAFVLVAMLRIHEVTGEARFLERAHRVYEAIARVRTRDQAAPWVTFVDDSQYLWFEEYVAPAPEPRVLNGHLYTVMAIYSYHRVAPSAETELLLRAGLTTVQRYLWTFRRPGMDNRYGLGLGELRDYSPQRSVDQQAWLYAVTGEEMFDEARRAFLTDMRF
ncbi:MAG: AGE family epimerase/isomerase [Planctomycetes bacterium]|nr:AGE family epimerase/isomerase [Planctomycetota bacterium]